MTYHHKQTNFPVYFGYVNSPAIDPIEGVRAVGDVISTVNDLMCDVKCIGDVMGDVHSSSRSGLRHILVACKMQLEACASTLETAAAPVSAPELEAEHSSPNAFEELAAMVCDMSDNRVAKLRIVVACLRSRGKEINEASLQESSEELQAILNREDRFIGSVFEEIATELGINLAELTSG